jgi:hypothetical protein
MNLDTIKPATLTASQRSEWRKAILDAIRQERAEVLEAESQLRALAGQLWEAAIDCENFDAAQRINEETSTWFTDDLEGE